MKDREPQPTDDLPGSAPFRRCVSCRRLAPRTEFWRFVRLANSQQVQLDVGMGRSAYLCPRPECLREAEKRNRVARALRTPIPSSLFETLSRRLYPSDGPSDSCST